MTDLRERLLSAERAAGAEVSADGVVEALQPAIRRGRAKRGGAVVLASAVAVVAVGAVAMTVVNSHAPAQPAVTPPATPSATHSVAPTITDAEQVSKAGANEVPGATSFPDAMWSRVDETWTLALWSTWDESVYFNAVLDRTLLIVAPDGRTWQVADVQMPGNSQLLAWDPVARTALVTTSPSWSTPVSEDANLGLISLSGGEDSWTSECLGNERIANFQAAQVAAPYDGNYVVRTGCGAEFVLKDGAGRYYSLDEGAKAALANATYPYAGIDAVAPTEGGARAGNTYVYFDDSTCNLLVRSRALALGMDGLAVQCRQDGSLQYDEGDVSASLKGFAGHDTTPFFYQLCGMSSVVGTLSDGIWGVGRIDGDYAKPLVLDGAAVSSCRDGRITWYIAGGDLYSAASDDTIVRLVDLTGDASHAGGIVAVAPAPTP